MEPERLTKDALETLLGTESTLAVTIYAPMHTTASPPHITENQIRLKNLLTKAADEVRTHDKHTELPDELYKFHAQAHDNLQFWENQTPGLLICAVPGSITLLRLPIDTEEYVAVDTRFHLAPLLGLMHDERDFYVLSLAQHEPCLYSGDLYGLKPAGITLPKSVKEALNIDEPGQRNAATGRAAGTSVDRSFVSGRGDAQYPVEEDRIRFFRLIDRTICDKAERNRPLILAGIEAETVEYRDISRYPQLLEGIIPGNHKDDDLRTLFEEAAAIVQRELIIPDHRAAIEEYERLSGANPERVAGELKAIAEAAEQGRIDKLLARLNRRTADTVRDQPEEVPRITFPKPAESKRLNDIAHTVWQTSGTIYNLTPTEMPHGELLAARLRY